MVQFLGTIGVDLFFVLSGFLIGSLIIKQVSSGRTRFKDFLYFWVRRWFKTLPNYYLILIINVLLAVFLFDLRPINYGLYFLFLQNFNGPMPEFFTESWSLSIEEFSYIIGPLLLFIFIQCLRRYNKYLFLFCAIAIIVFGCYMRFTFSLSHDPLEMSDWSRSLRKVVLYRIDSIYYGFIGAYLATYKSRLWKKYRTLTLVIGVVMFVSIHFNILVSDVSPESSPIFFNVFYLPLLLISLLLFFPYYSTWKDSHSRMAKPITYISLVSYAMYLVNYSIVLLTLNAYIDIESLNWISKLGVLILFWTLTLLLSHLLYHYYEKPIMAIREHPKLLKALGRN